MAGQPIQRGGYCPFALFGATVAEHRFAHAGAALAKTFVLAAGAQARPLARSAATADAHRPGTLTGDRQPFATGQGSADARHAAAVFDESVGFGGVDLLADAGSGGQQGIGREFGRLQGGIAQVEVFGFRIGRKLFDFGLESRGVVGMGPKAIRNER